MVERSTRSRGDAAGPSRPPARSETSNSRHHLEPNPFEQSFSSKPEGEDSPASTASASKKADSGRANGAARDAAKAGNGKNEAAGKGAAGNSGAGNATSGKDGEKGNGAPGSLGSTTSPGRDTPGKRLLPPVASITSPANEGGLSYPWSGTLASSLRAGPLSPAMLPGPQSQPFDPSAFRTGFTPDLSSFKTGLTPLGGGPTSFPPPSPNTAAFLAMVTNGGGGTGATITPNTLSALTGNPPGGNGAPREPIDYFNGKPGQQAQPPARPRGSSADAGQQQPRHDAGVAPTSVSVSPEMMQKPLGPDTGAPNGGGGGIMPNGRAMGPGQPNATQAASGLFLLSQAHQELAKREGAVNGHPGYGPPGFGPGPAHPAHMQHQPPPNRGPTAQAPPRSHKRKKSSPAPAGPAAAAAPTPAARGGQGARKKSKGPVKSEMHLGQEDQLESSDDEGSTKNHGGSDGKGGGLEEDDEEKRKSFLERNRQAALKCRQRKKAWLASLQAKVEFLQTDNENLQGTVGALRNEVMFLKSQLMQAQQQLAAAARGEPIPSGPNGLMAPPPPPHGHHPHGPPHSHGPEDPGVSLAVSMAVSGAPLMSHHGGVVGAGGMPLHHGPHMGPIGPPGMEPAAGVGPGQYQAHAVPRPTHIPGHYGAEAREGAKMAA